MTVTVSGISDDPPIPQVDFAALLREARHDEFAPPTGDPVLRSDPATAARPLPGPVPAHGPREPAVTDPPADRGRPADPPGQAGPDYPVIADPEDTPGFARSVADAIERLAPTSSTALGIHQVPPPEHDDPESEITGWVMQAGRGAGKTHAGARWLHRHCSRYPGTRARIIAPSFADAVASCVEGPAGILEASGYTVEWKPSHAGGAQLRWPNGSVCYVLGTPTPREVDRLRALTNIDVDWFEEAAANTQIQEVERQARLSRRRKGAKWIATTTPRPIKVIRDWRADPHVRISNGTARDNPNVDPLWLAELERMYQGTRLYRQEVLGEVLEDVEGALWAIAHLDRSRITDVAEMYELLAQTGHSIVRAAVGVDPANSTGTTGVVAVLMSDDRHLYVVEDASMQGRTAEQWARAAVDLALKWNAVLVPENDSGGDAIRAVLKAADLLDEVSIFPARARGVGGKGVRAEPVSLLWERDDYRGHLVGSHPLLEDQMTTYVPDMPGQESPDRMDAFVWACTYLWGRASFSEMSSRWPNTTADPAFQESGLTSARRRPGAAIRWHRGSGKHKEKT